MCLWMRFLQEIQYFLCEFVVVHVFIYISQCAYFDQWLYALLALLLIETKLEPHLFLAYKSPFTFYRSAFLYRNLHVN